MRLALELAGRGRRTARPNPMVGAVAVQGDRILGQGYHLRPGEPHAEVHTLDPVPASTTDVTLYVTLEPCCHTGRTPPCTELIIGKGVTRVVCAMADPDERVAGRGIARLREAGITVDLGLMEPAARALNAVYVKHRSTGLPFVTLKLAQSLDGRIATPTGDSKWITSPASRARAHELRADADAVLVGINTVVADDPQLSVRHVEGPQPAKIVLDSRLRISTSARIFEGSRLIVATSSDVSESRRTQVEAAGARVWAFPPTEGRPRLSDVLTQAAKEDLLHLLIEGGGTVASSALREGLVDRVAVFIAPKILGEGIPAVGDLGIAQVAQAVHLCEVAFERIGEDLFYSARVRTPESGLATKA